MSSQSQSQSQGEELKRFAHLLEPIRDLSKNWDIDIAGDLEEYLDEVRACGARSTRALCARQGGWRAGTGGASGADMDPPPPTVGCHMCCGCVRALQLSGLEFQVDGEMVSWVHGPAPPALG